MRAVAAAAFVFVAACTELPTIDPGVCGNAILDDGEQCDTFPDPGLGTSLHCGPAGGIHACTYECEADGDPACPTGWACAADGRCRHASGVYDPAPGSPRQFLAAGMGLGDVDGDRNLDLIGYRVSGLTVAFGSPGGELRADISRSTDLVTGIPAFGNVDTGATTDVILPAASGLIGLRGQGDRTLSPIIYSSLAFDDSPRFVAASYGESPTQLVVFRGTNMELYDTDHVSIATVPLPGGNDALQLSADIPVLDVDGSGEPEMFLSMVGQNRIWVYTITTSTITQIAELTLPGPLNAGPRVGDFNQDDLLDVMVAILETSNAPAGPCYDPAAPPPFWMEPDRVAFAWGNPLTGLDAFVVDPAFDTMVPNCCGTRAWPSAIGRLNGDTLNDAVGEWAVCVQDGVTGSFTPIFFGISFGWTQAAITDFNRDGSPDLAALDYQGLDILLGNGSGLFSRYRTDFGGGANVMRVGDFDGDFFPDVALGVAGRVELFFGSVQGGPDGPVTVSSRHNSNVGAMQLATLDADLTTDLIVATEDLGDDPMGGVEPVGYGPSSFAFLRGNTQRSMLSPFELRADQGAEVPDYAFLGRFDAGGDQYPDVVAFSHDNNAISSRVWLMRGDQQGNLSPAAMTFGDLPMSLQPQWQCMIWRQGDLDNDPATPDVLVGLTRGGAAADGCAGPRDGEAEMHALWLDDSSGDALVVNHTASLLAGYMRDPILAELADMNGDGLPELIVTYSWSMDTTGLGAGAAIYPNVAGAIDPEHPAYVNRFFDSTGQTLSAWPSHARPINADGDPEMELAILAWGYSELDFLQVAGVYIADRDETGALSQDVHAVVEVPGFSGAQLLIGDVSGDGLDDILFSVGSDVHIYTARAGTP